MLTRLLNRVKADYRVISKERSSLELLAQVCMTFKDPLSVFDLRLLLLALAIFSFSKRYLMDFVHVKMNNLKVLKELCTKIYLIELYFLPRYRYRKEVIQVSTTDHVLV